MNPYLERLGGMMPQPVQQPLAAPMNPMQRVMMVRQAMMNPLAFIKQRFPDIPDQISGDPNQILNYIQQTRGITDQQVQQVCQNYGGYR